MRTDRLYQYTQDVEQDMGLRLTTEEISCEDVEETPDFWNGDKVGYSTSFVLETTLTASGFEWDHPRGGVISGAFAKPIVLAEATFDQYGQLTGLDCHASDVALAIVTKLGNVSEIDDVLLGMAAAAKRQAEHLNSRAVARA
ncbi:hypothetical protein [Mesorhizobium sp. B2-3-10]|uniref:hypothetical protein n=1 Tax=Mesorhizobium sp. B2-3-10 TaxID=2589954 RepID=UPI0011272914|nr:hypothetical protein [Mesorhizobium sp. B2-3-10]TPL94758.1 hypothetical protein FJ943_25065 [Mesorhizobium sp. B2-3-10]